MPPLPLIVAAMPRRAPRHGRGAKLQRRHGRRTPDTHVRQMKSSGASSTPYVHRRIFAISSPASTSLMMLNRTRADQIASREPLFRRHRRNNSARSTPALASERGHPVRSERASRPVTHRCRRARRPPTAGETPALHHRSIAQTHVRQMKSSGASSTPYVHRRIFAISSPASTSPIVCVVRSPTT